MTAMWSTTSVGALCALIYCLFVKEIAGSPIIVERLDSLATIENLQCKKAVTSVIREGDPLADRGIHQESCTEITACPRIVTREQWKARNATAKHKQLPFSPTPYVTIHHGGILHYCYDQPECSAVVRSYQDLHIDERHWIDIGYNFVIGEDGNVYEGRGWDYVGAHAPGYNTQSIGISVIGDFSHFIPNKPALKALKALIACGVELGKIMPDYKVIGHRQGRDTVCPGEVFYEWVQKMPGWTSSPTPVYSDSGSATTTTSTQTPLNENTLEHGNIPKDESV